MTVYCPECGPVATCDADGLCIACGCTVFLSTAPWFVAALAAARAEEREKERERCARVAEKAYRSEPSGYFDDMSPLNAAQKRTEAIAAAIRAGGEA